MFLRQFEYLIALEKEGHFGRAAERCHVSQPSLSSGLNQLEEELGVPIILRHQRFQGFTPEGECVINWTKRLLADQKGMLEDLAIMRRNLHGTIRIGAMPMSSPVLPIINNIFSAKYPSVKFDIEFVGSERLIKEVCNFELDVGITYLEDQRLNRFNKATLYKEKLSLMIPKTMLPPQKKTINWKEAANLPLCLLSPFMKERQVMDTAFESVACNPSPKLECNSIFQLAFHVMHGNLATIVPSGFSQVNDAFPGTREIPLTNPVVSKPVGLIWEKVNPPLPMAHAFSKVLVDSSKQLSNTLTSIGDKQNKLQESK